MIFQTLLQSADATPSTSFGLDDLKQWRPEEVAALLSSGVLEEAGYSTSVICPGCELHCLAEAELLSVQDGEAPRAHVVCQERDDIGRVPIPLERLSQWRVSLDVLAEIVTAQVATGGVPINCLQQRLWRLGQIPTGGDHSDVFLARGTQWDDAAVVLGQAEMFRGSSLSVVLTLSDAAAEDVFGESVRAIPLSSMLSMGSGGLELDRRAITREIRRRQRHLSASRAKLSPTPDPVLVIRPKTHQVFLRGEELDLSGRSFKLLLFLMEQVTERGGGWARRDDIYDFIWTPRGEDPTVEITQVDDTVRELRTALNSEEAGSGKRLIGTKPDFGYRLLLKPSEVTARKD